MTANYLCPIDRPRKTPDERQHATKVSAQKKLGTSSSLSSSLSNDRRRDGGMETIQAFPSAPPQGPLTRTSFGAKNRHSHFLPGKQGWMQSRLWGMPCFLLRTGPHMELQLSASDTASVSGVAWGKSTAPWPALKQKTRCVDAFSWTDCIKHQALLDYSHWLS